MKASELNNLVNGPYAMRDGTMRRGLWERVPECKPERLLDYEYTDDGGRDLVTSDGLYSYSTDDVTVVNMNAALIFWSLFRWCILNSPPTESGFNQPTRVFSFALTANATAETFKDWHVMQDVVYAAHFVADSLGIAP